MGLADNDKKGPVRLHELLAPAPAKKLGSLLARARALADLEARLRRALPGELREGWRLGRMDADEVVLIAQSPAWASRLRYSRPLVLDAVRLLTGRSVRRFRIKIAPQRKSRRPLRKAQLGKQAAFSLRQAADGLGSDNEALSRALRRLARHGTRDEE